MHAAALALCLAFVGPDEPVMPECHQAVYVHWACGITGCHPAPYRVRVHRDHHDSGLYVIHWLDDERLLRIGHGRWDGRHLWVRWMSPQYRHLSPPERFTVEGGLIFSGSCVLHPERHRGP